MSLNNLAAAPGFAAWMQGEPLDIERLLFTPAGKPRISIISIAHLSDSERMFAVTLLLGEYVAWMRRQSGTSSLRALLYMDEIFGYFPPTAMPPSKQPLLTLMKQARAFGLGVVLATQNPVDLDYKGLSNAGTWFIGRLQTERDKARVIDGLLGAGGEGLGSQQARSADRESAGPYFPDAQCARSGSRCCSKRAGPCRICAVRSRWLRSQSSCPTMSCRSSRQAPRSRARECNAVCSERRQIASQSFLRASMNAT